MTTRTKHDAIHAFAEWVPWVSNLRDPGRDVWLEPIPPGAWSLREVLTHIMHWDRNSMEIMIPRMNEGAELFFVNIEEHNRQAALSAEQYTDWDVLIDEVIKTRLQLLDMLAEVYDESVRFTIDGEAYTYGRFTGVFIHHDAHHREQVDVFLGKVL
ncbi:DinB family protein [Paenibacillus sp. S-38]|uniref:DinB family protein n=1 Tax=Paenibacillus sp. S-38 TaxID=3416710 RepID=UPI003CF0D711